MQSKPILNLLNENLKSLPTYKPGRPIEEVARELGLSFDSIIKLASNENPLGPPEESCAAITVVAAAISHPYPTRGAIPVAAVVVPPSTAGRPRGPRRRAVREAHQTFRRHFVASGRGWRSCRGATRSAEGVRRKTLPSVRREVVRNAGRLDGRAFGKGTTRWPGGGGRP